MKKLLFVILLCAGAGLPALAQSNPPLRIREADGSPNVNGVTQIVVTNGSITQVQGKSVYVTTGGGGGSGTVTSVAFTGGLISVANPTTAAALTVAGTSGGIPYFSGSSTWASSAALTANALVIGGGAGVAPSTTTTGTGILTFLGAPSSANFLSAVTDETGSGLVVANNTPTIITPSFTTGFTIGGAAATGTIPRGNGTNFVASTFTMAAPGTSGNVLTSDGTNWLSSAPAGGGITVGTTTVTGGTATRLFYETAGNVVGQTSGATSDGTNVTFGSGNLRATLPQITTGWNDVNGNRILGITATGSATEFITIANNTATNAVSLTASSPTQGASAIAGTPLNVTASPAIAGNVNAGAAAGGSVTITAGDAARLTSGNANGGDIINVPGAPIGTGTQGTFQIRNTSGAPEFQWYRAFTDSSNYSRIVFRQPSGSDLAIIGEKAGSPSGSQLFFRNTSGGSTHIETYTGGSWRWTFGTDGSLGFSSSATSVDVFIKRNAAANLALGAADAAAPVAQTLSVQNVVAGTSNTAGVNWTLRGSAGTGNATPGRVLVQTSARAASGTTQQGFNTRLLVGGSTDLTDATATNLFTITLPTLTAASGTINFSAIAADATDVQVRSAVLRWSTVNKAGTYTNEIVVISEAASVSTGTLTCTFDFSNGSDQTTIRVNCDTSLTATSFRAHWDVVNSSPQAVQ